MAALNEAQREQRIASLLALAPVAGARAVPLESFASAYFRQVDPEDLDEREPEDLRESA